LLVDQDYTAIVRHSKGRDISAACGQLKARSESSNELGPIHKG